MVKTSNNASNSDSEKQGDEGALLFTAGYGETPCPKLKNAHDLTALELTALEISEIRVCEKFHEYSENMLGQKHDRDD